jgi:predicted metal-dependent peptidase
MESLSKIRTALMNDDIAKEICKDLGIGEWFLTSVPIRYEEIKVTAKTVNGNIILNPKLMKKPFDILMRYIIHELVHAIQHIHEYGEKQTDKRKDYLNREDELEAFQYQVKFDEEHRGEDKAERYVDRLLNFHDVPEGKKKEKKKEIMEKAASN